MNLLFIANRFPYPPYRGDKLKIYNLARKLSKDHDLYLLTFIQNKEDYKHIPEIEKHFKEVKVVYLPKYLSAVKCFFKMFSSKPFQLIYFESSKFRKLDRDFMSSHKIDAVHIQHLRMSQYGNEISGIWKILDLPDAYSLYWKRRATLKRSFLQKWFDEIEYKRVLNYEKIIKQFDLNLVCSEEDKNILEETHRVDNVRILPNGVDLDFFRSMEHDYSIDKKIIFTGNMDYSPNVDGTAYFVKDILPLIRQKVAGVKFYIVGQKPVPKVIALKSENVIVTGFVPEINEEYNSSAVAVSPIRYGAGTLNKVLEPMAMGVPVVSTKVGFKGLGVKSGEGVILANEAKEFADAVIRLLSDEAHRKETGLKGQKVILEKFSWDKIAKILEGYFKESSND